MIGDLFHRFINRNSIYIDNNLRVLRRIISHVDTGEILILPQTGFGIMALVVTLFASLNSGLHVDFNEIGRETAGKAAAFRIR